MEKKKIYEFYEGCRIAFLSLEQKDLCRPLKEAGCTIVLDSAWSDMLSLEWYYDAFPYVDYFIPNSMEAMKITGADTPVSYTHLEKHQFRISAYYRMQKSF